MLTRLRSLAHIASFLVSSEWGFLAAVGGFLVGLLPALFRLPFLISVVLGVLGAVLAVLLLVRDTHGLLRRWSSWTMRRLQPPIRFAHEPMVPGLPILVQANAGTVAISHEIDGQLAHAVNQLHFQERPYELPDRLRELAPYIIRTAAAGRWPFNGPNVGLISDMTETSLRDGNDLAVRRGDFYSALCSNELTGWVMTDRGDRFDFPARYLLDTQGAWLPLSTSQLNNGIGVSILAVTTDDKLVVTLQSARSQTSAGLWAPSGSGALEPRDITATTQKRLIEVVTKAATRELEEETRVPAKALLGCELIGYGRWLDRGGKPEFFCVTALNVHSSEMAGGRQLHGIFSEERLWTATVELVPLDLSAPSRKLTVGDAPRREPIWRESGLVADSSLLDGSLSVPLEIALDALARRLARHPDDLSAVRGLSV